MRKYSRHALVANEKKIPPGQHTEFLHSNQHPYTIGKDDMLMLSQEDSVNYFIQKYHPCENEVGFIGTVLELSGTNFNGTFWDNHLIPINSNMGLFGIKWNVKWHMGLYGIFWY